jgi:multiple sugar transport system permease protein
MLPLFRHPRPRTGDVPTGSPLRHALLLAGAALMLFPFFWMTLTAFKDQQQTLKVPPSFWPDPWVWRNIPETLTALPFGRAYLNSTLVAILVVALTLLTTAMAGYAFARIDFPGRGAVFMLFLATMMVPRQVTLIPLYLVMARLGWIDSLLAIIVPPALLNAFGVFMMRQFVRAIPPDLEEAALLDGANRWTIFRTIILPILKPGLAALGILTFLETWNSFLLPLIFLNSPENFTVPLLVNQFRGQFGTDYGHMMAGAGVAIIPVLIVYVIGQRAIIESVATSGVTGR